MFNLLLAIQLNNYSYNFRMKPKLLAFLKVTACLKMLN